jgi:hypothetical protein
MKKAAVAVVAAAGLVLASCSVFKAHKYDKLDAEQKAGHFGTQAGYHRLSPYFSTQCSGGTAGSDRLMNLYFYPNGTSRKKLIGTIEVVWYESADYGPREQHFALSSAGTKLLYFHESAFQFGPVNKPDGLYLAASDGTDRLVRSGGSREISPAEARQYLGAESR